MQTQRYEALILTIPEITNDEAREIEQVLDKKLQELKGKLVSYDRWGKYQLAYTIKQNEYGVYFLARFEVPSDKKAEIVKEIQNLFDLKFNETIMRHLTAFLDNNEPLDYKRPQSLEETPKDVDQFLKENKMAGFSQRRNYSFDNRERTRSTRETPSRDSESSHSREE